MRTITSYGDKKVNPDEMHNEIYLTFEPKGNKPHANAIESAPTLGPKPKPDTVEVEHVKPKRKRASRKSTTSKQDKALLEAHNTDLNKKNLK